MNKKIILFLFYVFGGAIAFSSGPLLNMHKLRNQIRQHARASQRKTKYDTKFTAAFFTALAEYLREQWKQYKREKRERLRLIGHYSTGCFTKFDDDQMQQVWANQSHERT